MGAGAVHHVAWASTMDDHEEWQQRVAAAGLRPTPIIDRFWFRSIYFREPSGVLFEIATLGPGFDVDEDPEHLGEALVLPPDFEHLREKLEPVLTPLPPVAGRGLADSLKKKPRTLSGGQRQRVAMGRAIVREPEAFLMDEPLSNLDAKLRVEMRTEISRIQRDLGVTTIYVTHDQTEAMTMGDRVAVLRGGILQQVDSPQNLYTRPANLFVAEFIGSPAMNLVQGTLVPVNGGLGVRFGDHMLRVAERSVQGAAGTRLVCGTGGRGRHPAGGHRGRRLRSRAKRRPDAVRDHGSSGGHGGGGRAALLRARGGGAGDRGHGSARARGVRGHEGAGAPSRCAVHRPRRPAHGSAGRRGLAPLRGRRAPPLLRPGQRSGRVRRSGTLGLVPGWIGPGEIVILLIVALLVFGPKRLPEMGRSIGKGMREFKTSLTMSDDDDAVPELPAEEPAPQPPKPKPDSTS